MASNVSTRRAANQLASRRRFLAITLAFMAIGWGFSLLGVGRHVLIWLFVAFALMGFMAVCLSAYCGYRLANELVGAVLPLFAPRGAAWWSKRGPSALSTLRIPVAVSSIAVTNFRTLTSSATLKSKCNKALAFPAIDVSPGACNRPR